MASGRYRLTAVLAVLIVAGTTAAGWHGFRSAGTLASRNAAGGTSATGTTAGGTTATGATAGGTAAGGMTSASLPEEANKPLTALALASAEAAASPHPAQSATPAQPALSAAARKACPPAATACVDLTDHLTWLQSHGRISFGPIAMEPGAPGTSDATPRGTFHVTWKASANYMSNEYHEPMPWATFFVNGVAFHGGSLIKHSHGCVHLAIGDARYYHDHLAIGAEVVVFLARGMT